MFSQRVIISRTLFHQFFTDYKCKGKPLDFEGMYVTVLPSKLQESSFEDIDASSSIEAFFDIAELYDVSKGGQFSLQSEGVLSFGAPGGRSLIGSISYTSNLLNVNVNGTEATEARALSPLHQKRALVDKRIVVQSDCSGDRHQTILTGLFMCTIYADAAFNKTVAPDANDKMLEYFKRADADTKIHVANGFLKIRNVCGQYTSGDANLFCTDQFNGCHGDTGAYTIPSSSNMVFCPGFFDWHADTPQGCHNPDLGTTVLHEVSHLRQTLATDDYGTYGYDGLRRLSADQNLNHADTYTYYAQALIAHC